MHRALLPVYMHYLVVARVLGGAPWVLLSTFPLKSVICLLTIFTTKYQDCKNTIPCIWCAKWTPNGTKFGGDVGKGKRKVYATFGSGKVHFGSRLFPVEISGFSVSIMGTHQFPQWAQMGLNAPNTLRERAGRPTKVLKRPKSSRTLLYDIVHIRWY